MIPICSQKSLEKKWFVDPILFEAKRTVFWVKFRFSLLTSFFIGDTVEEILHQLVDGLSHYNPIIYWCRIIVPNTYKWYDSPNCSITGLSQLFYRFQLLLTYTNSNLYIYCSSCWFIPVVGLLVQYTNCCRISSTESPFFSLHPSDALPATKPPASLAMGWHGEGPTLMAIDEYVRFWCIYIYISIYVYNLIVQV